MGFKVSELSSLTVLFSFQKNVCAMWGFQWQIMHWMDDFTVIEENKNFYSEASF